MTQFKRWFLKFLWTILPLPRRFPTLGRKSREFTSGVVTVTGSLAVLYFCLFSGLWIVLQIDHFDPGFKDRPWGLATYLGWTVFVTAHAIRLAFRTIRQLGRWAAKGDLAPPSKASFVGAPAIFFLENACKQISTAYAYLDHHTIYHVGSSLNRPDWRDVDLRMILSDDDFRREFPDARDNGAWESDTKWALLTTLISKHLSRLSGLPVDFQFQPMSWANDRYKTPRSAIGLTLTARQQED